MTSFLKCDGTIDFISPHVPARRLLPCKKLYAGEITHKGNDLIPYNVRLFAVLLHRAYNELVDARRLPFWVSFACKQTDFRVASCPKAQPVKPCTGFPVCFQPDKGDSLIPKAPCFYQTQGFWKLRKGRPEKQNAVCVRKIGDRQRRQFFKAHGGVMMFRRAGQSLLFIPPRRIGVDDIVFLCNAIPPLMCCKQGFRYGIGFQKHKAQQHGIGSNREDGR